MIGCQKQSPMSCHKIFIWASLNRIMVCRLNKTKRQMNNVCYYVATIQLLCWWWWILLNYKHTKTFVHIICHCSVLYTVQYEYLYIRPPKVSNFNGKSWQSKNLHLHSNINLINVTNISEALKNVRFRCKFFCWNNELFRIFIKKMLNLNKLSQTK